jgi:hypothetical protein
MLRAEIELFRRSSAVISSVRFISVWFMAPGVKFISEKAAWLCMWLEKLDVILT